MRRLIMRQTVQWAVFCLLMLVVTASTDYLYGEPTRPSFEVFSNAVNRHGAVFAAMLVLIPIMLRDSVRFMKAHLKRLNGATTEPTPQPTGEWPTAGKATIDTGAA